MDTHGQILRPEGTRHTLTAATALARTAWVNFDIRSTGTCSLVARIGGELVPGSIRNAFRQRVVADHPCDAQVFEHDDAKLVDQSAAELMHKVLPPVRNPFVDMRNNLSPFTAFRRSLFGPAELALGFDKCPFIRAKEARIGDLFARRKRREMRQANIHPNGALCFGQWFRLRLNREAGKPFAGGGTPDRECLDRTVNRTMGKHLHASDLRYVKPLAVDLEGVGLRVGHTIVPARALEPWVARCFPTLEAAKERFEGKIHPLRHILQHLGMDGFQRRPFTFQQGNAPFGFVPIRRALLVFPRRFAVGKRVVVQPAAFFKHLREKPLLALCRSKSELIRFRHMSIIPYFSLKPGTLWVKQMKGFYPSGYPLAGEAPGVYALSF
jgi:hypothetical protein